MYSYGYVLLYTYIHFHWKEHDHVNERQMLSRSHYALPVSTTLLRRWHYVNTVSTTLVLCQSGSYYVVTRSLPRSLAALLLRKFRTCSKFDHVLAVLADITTLLPRFYYAHPGPTMLIRFSLHSRFLKERSKDVVETWPGVTGVLK